MKEIKELRKKFTQTKLALLLEVSVNTIAKWEMGISSPDDSNKAKIIKLYEEMK